MENIRIFDEYLFKTLTYLFEHWYQEETGIVACCIKDKINSVFATSVRNGAYWLHAERNAYHKYQLAYGEPSKEAVFITTLSPCIQPLKYRHEPACTELITRLGVKRIHFGVMDTMHASDIMDYEKMGFFPSLTSQAPLHEMCYKLMKMFSLYKTKINTELLSVKRTLGDNFFSILDKVNI